MGKLTNVQLYRVFFTNLQLFDISFMPHLVLGLCCSSWEFSIISLIQNFLLSQRHVTYLSFSLLVYPDFIFVCVFHICLHDLSFNIKHMKVCSKFAYRINVFLRLIIKMQKWECWWIPRLLNTLNFSMYFDFFNSL